MNSDERRRQANRDTAVLIAIVFATNFGCAFLFRALGWT